MKIFDFNIHLPYVSHEDVNKVIENDLHLDVEGLVKGFQHHYAAFQKVEGANFLLFNPQLFDQEISSFQKEIASKMPQAVYTALIDFRRPDILTYLERAKSQGVSMLMVNSYLQRISEADYSAVYQAFKFAEEQQMIICIDGSYGTSKMYTYDNLKLACFIADLISKTPIVIIHSGGYRIMEAALLAMDKPNVYLDTSFSLPFYLGSSLEQDYVFAYRKIGLNRIVFGSDHPYHEYAESQDQHLAFFERHGFSSEEIENIFYHNAINLLESL